MPHQNFIQVISKGMTKDVVKTNGQIAKKLVKESEDKKANGEEIVDKQVQVDQHLSGYALRIFPL